MIKKIISFSVYNKLLVFLFVAGIVGFGTYSLINIPIGALPDVTNNQVQVITTSRNLSTEDVEKFLTYPVEIEMANLPGVKEIRSVSKFGLSVVTVVFDEDMGTYLPRQLISEKLITAQENIPQNFGTPFMGPITTGLGEIYQYTLEVQPAFKDEYSLTDLRTIQDWIVKRQLSGIPGVVEVNTWGGYLKQYEITVNPIQLRSMNVTLEEIYQAAESNNSVSGGGYIERGNEAIFIRGEGQTKSVQDIENTVVTVRDGNPIRIKDVAQVKMGHATRFGAITGNGEGEKVMGQVMMLKGADSKKVIGAVNKRVDEIQSALPEGVYVNGFLERSELVNKTTFTITENLVLGSLIVIFVVVLLIGNLRSGLIIASVIPLSLLFALSLMYLFHVDANLMSLGAIDFGIIIDGAVIIVEFIVARFMAQSIAGNTLDKGRVDEITINSATKMMRSAIFGQLIIMIVFIPILALSNIEGKMFRPMALVFIFALLGAMILGMTYVPVVSSLFIKTKKKERRSLSDRLIGFLQKVYAPVIQWAMNYKKIVLGVAGLVLIIAGFIFSRMGGEFIPTLDEGDFVIQPALKTGTSLEETIKKTTQMEQILMKFPEVEQVVSRIGAAEVPTDPMSMEESDVIIKLKPKSQWQSADSKDELAELFKEELSIIPGVEFEFTQPIEMRFNELITGVRADVAIKIYGEDLGILYKKAKEVEEAIQHVDGAADITVEKIDGLPQMSIEYDRNKISKYGLTIAALNDIVSMSFAGKTAGTIFEGEKRFDLVVRYDEAFRNDIDALKELTITTPNGQHLPFKEFANITFKKGPAKISRDDTKRRVVIGVNVRNRDMESVVQDIQKIVDTEIDLPAGYTVEYGGQFENLRTAKQRLMIAVPIALVLIFVLLYLAFRSVRDALIIYSAIPLSAVGGILLLWIRDLPFSVSAGVGFIALFGIAVLNGIVLIEHFKELKDDGIKDTDDHIIKATKDRLRPVLLTASAAALGFLPMAISTSAGAEVQRPLATVVVGGLITATLLTLIVLPVLYSLFEGKKMNVSKMKNAGLIALLLLPAITQAQDEATELNEIIAIGIQNNPGLRAYQYNIEQKQHLEKTAFDPDKTYVYYNYDQNNIAPNDQALHVFGVTQNFSFPTIYIAKKRLYKSRTGIAQLEQEMKQNELIKSISAAYIKVLYFKNLLVKISELDSIYSQHEQIAQKRYQLGETKQLAYLSAASKRQEIILKHAQIEIKLNNEVFILNKLIATDSLISVEENTIPLIAPSILDTTNHPGILYHQKRIEQARLSKKVNNQTLLPDLELTYFMGRNNGISPNTYQGGQVGMALPIFFGAQRSQAKASGSVEMMEMMESENYMNQLMIRYESLLGKLNGHEKAIANYLQQGQEMVDALYSNALVSFETGEINYIEFTQMIESAYELEKGYYDQLLERNLTALEINYLM
jgi:cobalt-zinc-cadmium resistance protein CzcA